MTKWTTPVIHFILSFSIWLQLIYTTTILQFLDLFIEIFKQQNVKHVFNFYHY